MEFRRGLRKLDPRYANPCMLGVCRVMNRSGPEIPGSYGPVEQSERNIAYIDSALHRLGAMGY